MESDTTWELSASGDWERIVHGSVWTLVTSFRQGVPFHTLSGPHPAPDWTISGRGIGDVCTLLDRANERIRNHYAG